MNKGTLTIALVGAALLISVFVMARGSAQENVVLEDGVSVYPIAERMTYHFIENLVEKPKTNDELMRLYKVAFKNFEKTITECDHNDYNFKLIQDKK